METKILGDVRKFNTSSTFRTNQHQILTSRSIEVIDRVLVTDGVLRLVKCNGTAAPQKDGGETSPDLYNALWVTNIKPETETRSMFVRGDYTVPTSGTPYGMLLVGYKPFLPVVISLTEKPVDGDYVFYNNGTLEKTGPKFPAKEAIEYGWFKVIVHYSQLWTYKLYENKIEDGDPVLVECIPSPYWDERSAPGAPALENCHYVKLDRDKRATIHKFVEQTSQLIKRNYTKQEVQDLLDQMYSRDEVKKILDDYISSSTTGAFNGGLKELMLRQGTEWFNKNVK